VRSLFKTPLPEHPTVGKLYLGRIGDNANSCDEVVLAVKEDCLELHCHGGVEVVRFIQELFAGRGTLSCTWKEFHNVPGVSRIHRHALEQLMFAPTVKTAAILLDQVHGAFEKSVSEILGLARAGNRERAASLLARLVQTQNLGRHLVQPFHVVLAGAPNVGKSSLVNALAGFTRSVVSPIPGTTRDVVSTRIALDGWPVDLIDTAGLHESGDALERQGMAKAQAALQQADLRLWVLDASASPRLPPDKMQFHGAIINKIDLPWVWDAEQYNLPQRAFVSSKTGKGLTELCQWIGNLLGFDEVIAPGEGVAFSPEMAGRVMMTKGKDWGRIEEILEGLLG